MPAARILFWLYLLILVGADATAFNPADPDLWHRLALGEYLVQHHALPVREHFQLPGRLPERRGTDTSGAAR